MRHQVPDLLDMAKRRGASSSQLLSGTRLFEADCHKPQYRIDAAAWLKLVANCQQLPSPELPFLTASALLQNPYLALCQLVNSARDLRQALAQLLYFRQQLAPYLYVQLQSGAYSTRIELRPGIGLGAQQRFIAEIWLSLLLQLIRHQLGSTAGTVIYLRELATKTAAAEHTFWQTEVRYQQACDGIEIANSLWRQPFSGCDVAAFQNARRICRQQQRLLPKRPGVLEFAGRVLRRALPQLLSPEQLAAAMALTPSALKRLLAQHHTSYSQLLDEVRNQLAVSLLTQHELSNKQLAERLGYSDEHNFRRAFKRWTGLIPSLFKV
ncbi:AraC family transcriptional regulator [Rheinheimera riviphila]|uniref:AraC family transcriptional regulator n=2 Tax=Rheinheimera riviphila TaxID=1834037 RepID=A0A437QLX7_9GAMM|nr:AraC family transcriptional regulator [Rheinheimera riviphila]